MQRLTGTEAAFLYLETPSTHMQVTGALVLDPGSLEGKEPFAEVRRLLTERLHLLPPFRRRLVEVPFRAAHPVWIEDPAFDLDAHLHRWALPKPGSQAQLETLVGDLAGRPLDRTRPLWELHVVEGLEEGRIAVVTRIHHAAIDGVSGAELMASLFDLTPEIAPVPPPEAPWEPEPVPSEASLVAGAVTEAARSPLRLASALSSSARSFVARAGRGSNGPGVRPFSAPRTPFTGAVTARRSVAFGRALLADVKAVGTAAGATVNDVLLAATTSSLRSYLADRDALPDGPLVAAMPISARGEGEVELGVQVSVMLVPLPVHLEDTRDRLRDINEHTRTLKADRAARGGDSLADWAELTPPALLSGAARLYSGARLADRHPPIHNLVVSSIPGPPVPLYIAGATLEATYPMGPLIEGSGLNVTVLTNLGNVDVGIIACPDLVPDVGDLARGFEAGVAELLKTTASG
jgi:diacylglycerol O-acyltransferase / wax synthase